MESKGKIMLQWLKGMKCEQSFSAGIWYKEKNVLGELE